MYRFLTLIFVGPAVLLSSAAATAFSWDDLFNTGKELVEEVTDNASSGGSILDAGTIAKGLKAALEKGTGKAVSLAGVHDGYFKNPEIKIPLPARAEKYAGALRKVGLGKYVDELDESMNRAAEKAAPLAAEYFVDALKEMSIEDASKLLKGPDDSATQYFREKTSGRLAAAFRPTIDQSISQVGAIQAYDKLKDKAGKIGLGSKFSFDMSDYVTAQALDGLFTLIAKEEKNIRENPTARTTELLQQVFQ